MHTTEFAAPTPAALTLRTLLSVDGFTCLGAGMLMVLAAAPLSEWLGLPRDLLFFAGLALFPCAALMFYAARRNPAPAALVWVIIAGNAAWIVASIAVVLAMQPTTWGAIFVLAQAAVVAVLMALEWRRMRT